MKAFNFWRLLSLLVVGLVSYYFGTAATRRHADSSHEIPDSIAVVHSAQARSEFEKGLASASLPIASSRQTHDSPIEFLDRIPLSELKRAYEARMDRVQNKVHEDFPFPTSQKEMKNQIEDALKNLEAHFSEKIYWSAKSELRLGNKRVPLVLLFSINRADPNTEPIPSSITSTDHRLKNLCWSLDAIFPEKSLGSGGTGGCLEHLSKRNGQYFVALGFNGQELENHYLNMAVNIPHPDLRHPKFYLFSTDAQQWSQEATEVDWNPITESEAKEIQTLRSQVI